MAAASPIVARNAVSSAQAPAHADQPATRPQALSGKTYKVKSPTVEAAMYITITDFEVQGVLRPYEIFINSKDMAQFQWIVGLTRILSAAFRSGQNPADLADELESVFDPRGGYFAGGQGGYMNSVVAHIGRILKIHLEEIGLAR